jgi:hypothetical protein
MALKSCRAATTWRARATDRSGIARAGRKPENKAKHAALGSDFFKRV